MTLRNPRTALEWTLDFAERVPCDKDNTCVGLSVARRMCGRCRIRLALSHALQEQPNPITGGEKLDDLSREQGEASG